MGSHAHHSQHPCRCQCHRPIYFCGHDWVLPRHRRCSIVAARLPCYQSRSHGGTAVRMKGFELTLLALHSSLVNANWLITTVNLRSRPYELLSCIGQSRKGNLLCPQRLHRIKLRCLPRWDQARNHCNREQKHRGPHKHSGIKRRRATQQRTNQPRGCCTGHQSENQPGQCRTQPVQQRSSRSGEEHQKSRLDVPDARLKRRDDVSPPTQLKTRDHEVLSG
jgi:hypothetical protein